MALDRMQLAQRLRQLRREKSARDGHAVEQREVAAACGIGEVTYGSYERGASAPSFETACAIADYYGVSVESLRSVAVV